MKKIILLTIVSYFLLAPFTFHPDTKLTLRYAALENGKVWDIYGYLNSHKLDIPNFHYPPVHFWWLKIHYPISKLIGGENFDDWLVSGSAQASFFENSLRYNLAAKLPLLILGILSGYLIYMIVKIGTGDKNKSKIAALIWYFNPITLYSLVVMGQNDIVAVFLFLTGLLLYNKWWLAIPVWSLAAGVKNYPIIWAIMFMLAWEKNITKLVFKVLFLLIGYGLILSSWLSKDYFIKDVFNSGLSQRMFLANISIGYDKQILIIPVLLVILGLTTWTTKKNKNRLLDGCFVVFKSSLLILGFSHFNPQWMLWVVPFLSIWISTVGLNSNYLLSLIVILISWFVLILGFDDKFLTWGLFSPINSGLINFPTLIEFFRNKNINLFSIFNLSQTLLAGVALWFMNVGKNKLNKKTAKISLNKKLIFIPWLCSFMLVFFISKIGSNIARYANESNKAIYLIEATDKKWNYENLSNLKYFEVSLDNPSLKSTDKGAIIVADKKGNLFRKDFSGYNAGANSWLRVDVPASMSDAQNLSLEIVDIEINDGLLKIRLDNQDKWAVNFYIENKKSLNEIIGKISLFWWWWIFVFGISCVYVRAKED